jgi:hypothetical protein
MAGREVDRLGDPTATSEERAQRKRRLIKGPREFRDMRGDVPKTKISGHSDATATMAAPETRRRVDCN